MIEAFARILAKKPDIYRKGLATASFKAYLYKTARNLTIRFVGRRVETFSLDQVAELMDDKDPLRHIQNTEKSRILQVCLSRINPRYKEVLWLVYIEVFENVLFLARNGIDNLTFLGLRGFGTGAVHVVCGNTVAIGLLHNLCERQ